MSPVQVAVRLMEDYSQKSDSSREPQTVQPTPDRSNFKAQIFAEFEVRNSLFSSPPCPFVNPRDGDVQHTCSLRYRHQVGIPFIRRHTHPRAP
jgi:hypothetical protein